MPNEPLPSIFGEVPPGRYGNVMVLPMAGPGNATAEELTWPVVAARSDVRGTVITDPPVLGNATAEERTWPVVATGSRVISCPAPVEGDLCRVERELSELLTRLPPSDRELVLDRLGQLLLAHRAA